MFNNLLVITVLCALAFIAWAAESLLDAKNFDHTELVIIALLAICFSVLVGASVLHFGRFL